MSIETGIREYAEGMTVKIREENERLVVRAYNEGGYNLTDVDLLDILDWVKENKPELLNV